MYTMQYYSVITKSEIFPQGKKSGPRGIILSKMSGDRRKGRKKKKN